MSNYEDYIDEHNTLDADNIEHEIDEAVEQLMNFISEMREEKQEVKKEFDFIIKKEDIETEWDGFSIKASSVKKGEEK